MGGDQAAGAESQETPQPGVTFAIDPSKIPLAKEEIRRFRTRMAKLMPSDEPNTVYQLNIQFFELTEDSKQKEAQS